MEVALMEGGIARLQNTTFLARLFELAFELHRELGSFWTWGALVLAAVAAYSSLIARVRLVVYRLHAVITVTSLSLPHHHQHFDDDDDTCSSPSSSSYSSDGELEDEEELLSCVEEEEEEEVPEGYFGNYVEDGRPNFMFDLRLPELGRGGREVVKAWDGLGFEEEQEPPRSLISLWDLNRGVVVGSFLAGRGQVTAACMESPTLILSAGSDGRRVALGLWDARVGGQDPASSAEWGPPPLRQRVLGIGVGREGKVVYVADCVGSATAVDLRSVRSPLGRVGEGATWWDNDAVVVGGGEDDGLEEAAAGSGLGGGSAVVSWTSWCRNAVSRLPSFSLRN